MAISRIDIQPISAALARGATILVPSLRIKDAILAEIHGTQGKSSYPTAIVHPIDVWIRDLWQLKGVAGIDPCCSLQLMSGAEERFLWAQVIENSKSSIALLNPEETAAQVSQSYQDIQQWDLWETLINGEAHFQANLDVETFIRWAKEYRALCKSKQLIGLTDCSAQLIEIFDAGDSSYLPSEILLSNFDDPPPLYVRLFKSLKKLAQVSSCEAAVSQPTDNIVRYGFPDRNQEIKCCADWALGHIQRNANLHIGIILPSAVSDKGNIIRCFDETFRHHNALTPLDKEILFNSTGDAAPLTDFAVVHDALSLLTLVFSELDSNEVCRLLQSPFLFSEHDEAGSLLQAQLLARRVLSSRCTAAELSSILGRAKHPCFSPKASRSLLDAKGLIRESSKNNSPRHWAALFKSVLALFNWPGDSFSMDEKKLLTLWDEGLELFASSGTSLGTLGYNQALQKLRSVLKNLSPRPGFSSKRQLSLYTVSEAVGLRFDHAWLLGFDDQSWPQPSSPSPFLPYELQRDHNMPASHGENQFIIATQSFNALVAAVDLELVFSHFEADGDQELRASSFIKPTPLEKTPVADSWPLSSYSREAPKTPLHKIDDVAPLPLADSEVVKGGQSVLSNQSSCPFRGFAKHRLKATPLDPFASGLSSMARGTALHIAMEIFYSNIETMNELRGFSAEALARLINQACSEAVSFLQNNYRRVMTPRFSKIEQSRLEGLVSLFVDLEKTRNDFSVIAQEKKYQWQHGNLSLTLKVDRIDELGDGGLALIDYKTGKHTASKQSWLEDRPEDMQLPLYFVAASRVEQQPVTTLSIAHANIEKIEFAGLTATESFGGNLKPISLDDKIAFSWQELTELWHQRVTTIADQFVQGKSNVDPVNDSKTCEYCGLKSLCRVQSLREDISNDQSSSRGSIQ